MALDAKDLEKEAKATAVKHVANLLQKPDHLEKVEQHIRRVSRKKASGEAMLKTSMQTQLDGVKTGLSQLNAALIDIRDVKHCLSEVEETFLVILKHVDKLQDVKEESMRHSQYAAAVENMNQIFNVPERVEKTKILISEGKLLLAHQSLTDLENARDELLYEMCKLTKQSPTDRNMLKQYFSDVEKLSEQLGDQLWIILKDTLNYVRKEPPRIVTALRIVEREQCADRIAIDQHGASNFMPPGRPKQWKQKTFQVLKETTRSRIKENLVEDRTVNKSWLSQHLRILRQNVIDDLKIVKTACVPCFPPSYEIVKSYVGIYHECISEHLRNIIDKGLVESECIVMLTWINDYDGPEMMGHPDLNIDVKNLRSALQDVISKATKEYLAKLQINFQDWVNNSLSTDIKDWRRDIEPEKDGDGIFHTSLPVIVYQMMDQHMQVGITVGPEMASQVLTMSIDTWAGLVPLYKGAIEEFNHRHYVNRNQIQFFTKYMIAIANNCHQFCDLLLKFQQRHFKGPSEIMSHQTKKTFDDTLRGFKELKIEAIKFLREELFLDINQHLKELLTKKWFTDVNDIVDVIAVTVEDYNNDYIHLYSHNLSTLLADIEVILAKHYITAIFQRKISPRSIEERTAVAEKALEECTRLQAVFKKLSPFEQEKSPFDIVPALLEVIKLKDVSMLSLEITCLLRKYPDISVDQLTSLILFQGEMGKADARKLIVDIMAKLGARKIEKTLLSEIIC